MAVKTGTFFPFCGIICFDILSGGEQLPLALNYM